MAQGKMKEARETLLNAIDINPQEYGAYYELSIFLETNKEAMDLINAINLAKESDVTTQDRFFIEFAISNCFHKIKNYSKAAEHLQLANKYKLITMPSDIKPLRQAIKNSVLVSDPKKIMNINKNSGEGRVFIVGMPRSGSTLLETILSMNPEIKDLGRRAGPLKRQSKKRNNRIQSMTVI